MQAPQGLQGADLRKRALGRRFPENLSIDIRTPAPTDVNLEGPTHQKYSSDPQAAPGMTRPPLRITWFKDRFMMARAARLREGRRIGVIDPCLFSDLKNEHADGPQDVERLEPATAMGTRYSSDRVLTLSQ
jgi:hypothetical protein